MTMTKKAKTERILLGVLLVTAVAVWLFVGSSTSTAPQAASLAVSYKPMGVENPQIHHDRVADARNTEYKSTGRDIFNHDLPPPPPPPPVHIPQPGDADYIAPAPPPPPPPKLPLKFFGSGTVDEGTRRRAFLTDGDAVYIVGEGETVLGHFRVVKIGSRTLEFVEIGSGRHGSTVLEDQEPTV